MKTTYAYRSENHSIPFPNAATRQQLVHKALDTLLMAASGAGLGAVILLLLVMT